MQIASVSLPRLTVAWAMPSRWTFQIPPIADFVDRWILDAAIVVDPFSGKSARGTLNNDIARNGIDAVDWCRSLLAEYEGRADVVLFDPPYSPRQVKECYESVGMIMTKSASQTSKLYREVKSLLGSLLKPGGVALSFGWNSTGFGKKWPTFEILLCRHGGAHNDTICVAQRKPNEKPLF